ncbi:diguanylate cyclase/phosphodiesterase (GGDEF & EAL domains) with PAS/PAC sensor(s) [Pseudoalteromonas luteoviolacea B = ATCC 29581]|nr:diguanylate cyclase/phosphodiesterase (GGDEF & EAL domains) with PAS/PAC sensor(s) [Pseudoalteromonas luteoviolacea B = ATCC 29581]
MVFKTLDIDVLTKLLEHIPVGVAAADINTNRIVYANAYFRTMLGYNFEEIHQLTPSDIHPDSEQEERIRQFKAMAAGKLDSITSANIQKKDGSILIADIQVAAIENKHSHLLIATFQDVSQKYSDARKLKEQETRLRLALTASSQSWFDINLINGQTLISEEQISTLGLSPELKQRTFRAWHQWIHKDDRKHIFSAFRDYIKGKKESFTVQYRHLALDNTWQWSQATGKVVECTKNGKPKRLIGIVTNISKQKKLETQLELEKSYLTCVLSNIPDLVWLKNADGRYIGCNKRFEALYDAPEGRIIGHYDCDFVNVELADSFRHSDLLALQSKSPVKIEQWLTFKRDGHQELIEVTKTRLENQHGELIGVLGIGHDITDRHQTERQLNVAASVFHTAMEGIMITDLSGIIVDINDSFTRITGYTRSKAIGQNARILNSGKQSSSFYTSMWKKITQHGHWSGEIWNKRANGELFAEFLNISVVYDNQQRPSHYIAVFSDISTLKEQEKQLAYVTRYDALTGLANRSLFLTQLRQQLLVLKQTKLFLAIIVVDLDEFRQVNDQFGSQIGDTILVQAAMRFKTLLREHDLISRLGGDEFVILLNNLSGPEHSISILERLLLSASKTFDIAGHAFNLSASIGVTFVDESNELSAEKLVRQADNAMYQAKVAGKNRYHIFDPNDDLDTRIRFEMLNEIRRALIHKEFYLVYQPKVNLRTGDLVGFEALIRWAHPTKNLLHPNDFIPIINMHPLAIELGNWVLDEVMQQVAKWNRIGFHTVVSVNIDSLQLDDPTFRERLLNKLAKATSIKPEQIELEILETNALEQIENVSQLIDELQKQHITFALDDFGTGYSSMTFLKNLPVSTIKIDKSFVQQMLSDPEQFIIVESIINLSKRFGRIVLAEGVESEFHGILLAALGCDIAQGFGIGKPMKVDHITKWLTQWRAPTSWLSVNRLLNQEVDLLIDIVAFIHNYREINHCIKNKNTQPDKRTLEDKLFWSHKFVLVNQESTEFNQATLELRNKIESLKAALLNAEPQTEILALDIIQEMLRIVFKDNRFTIPKEFSLKEHIDPE